MISEIRSFAFQVEPPPAGAGGFHEQRDLPELFTRDRSVLLVAWKRFPPPAGAGGCQGAGLPSQSPFVQAF